MKKWDNWVIREREELTWMDKRGFTHLKEHSKPLDKRTKKELLNYISALEQAINRSDESLVKEEKTSSRWIWTALIEFIWVIILAITLIIKTFIS